MIILTFTTLPKLKKHSHLSDALSQRLAFCHFEKPYVFELNEINDDINTWKRLVKLEENRIEELGFEPTTENMIDHSFKYEGLLKKLMNSMKTLNFVKQKLKDFNSPNMFKTFVEGESCIHNWNISIVMYMLQNTLYLQHKQNMWKLVILNI